MTKLRLVRPLFFCFLGVFISLSAGVQAGELTLSGSVTGEFRYFTQAPAFTVQTTRRSYPSISFEPRLVYEWNDGNDSLVVSPFVRLDNNGIGRAHADLREAYWLHQGSSWSLTVGINKVYWGVAESNQLVDIINQDDALEDIYSDEKLGQTMVGFSIFHEFGTFDFFIMPVFRTLEFLSYGSRLNFPAPIREAEFASTKGKNNTDFAFRWSQSVGTWDIALSHFKGTSREPLLIPDISYTSGNWLWKLEAISRSGQGPQFWAAVGGFEWTLPSILGSGANLGLLVEYNHDTRSPLLAPLTIYDNDLFLGARLSLNDIANTSVLLGGLFDQKTNTHALLLEAKSRIGEDWVLGLEARFFTNAKPPDPVAIVNKDDFLTLTLKRSF